MKRRDQKETGGDAPPPRANYREEGTVKQRKQEVGSRENKKWEAEKTRSGKQERKKWEAKKTRSGKQRKQERKEST